MGLKVSDIESFAKREKKCVIPPPLQMTQQKSVNILQAGGKLPHPPYVPTHLPPFPDPHAYIRTPVSFKRRLSLFYFPFYTSISKVLFD